MRKLLISLLVLGVMSFCGIAQAGQFPEVYNVTLTLADTQYSQVLGSGVKKITFQCRTDKVTRYAYVTDKVATPTAPYMTLKASGVYKEDDLSTKRDLTLYLASSDAGVVVELLVWR